MGEKRKKRCRHEMAADILDALDEGAELNKNQIRLASGVGGPHLTALVSNLMDVGFLEWTGEATRPDQDPHYGQKLKATDRGGQWLAVWRLLLRVEDLDDKIRVTIMPGKDLRSQV